MHIWEKSILSPDDTIRAAIDNLTKSSTRIVLIVSEEGRFLGTVSDGDIRRGLLRGLVLDDGLKGIINTSAVTASPDLPRDAVKQIMLINKIQQIPIVSDEKRLLGLHEWNTLEAKQSIENLFVVMAGGEGKRLHPHTLDTPKPMVLIHGRPMLEHIVLKAKASGFQNFVFVVRHLSDLIEEYFKDGTKWGISISYIKEESPLGTAGGLAKLANYSQSPIIVTNGDVLSDLNYSDLLKFHMDLGCVATMAVRQYEISHPYGVVNLEGLRIKSIQEKPVIRNYINAGVYAISNKAIQGLKPGVFMNMTDFFDTLLSMDESVCAYPIHESWIDVGRPEDLKNFSNGNLED